MKQQYLRLFSFLIGITFIISGVVFTVVNNYKEEKNKKKQEEEQIADEIKDIYETFYNKEKELSEYRDTLLNDIKEFTVFYTQMPSGYGDILPKVEKYETLLIEIEDMSEYLHNNCSKRYSVLEANDKCDAYYKNLEKSINIFIGDIELFNSKIRDYNDWTEEENASVIKTQNYDKLSLYVANKYTEYVDINDDGTYLGMKSE